MQYRQLGSTDMCVSRITFGCWQLSPFFWGEIPVAAWEEAVHTALDAGINFIDTADAYGNGYAEECLGKMIEGGSKFRDSFYLATKFYWNFDSGKETFPDTSHDHIIRSCENSLRRLRTDRIDLYQIHAFDPLTRPDEVAAALLRLRREGKVRWFGVSNLNAEQMRMYARYLPLDSLQPPYSLITREIEESILPYCLTEDIGVMVYSPLYRGLFGGKYKAGDTFKDSRSKMPFFQGAAFARLLEGVEELRPLAKEMGLSLPEFAVNWVLRHPAITTSIAGIKTSEHVTGIVKAVSKEMTAEMWDKAGDIMELARSEAAKLAD